jgi:hypothetical protein
MSEEKQIDLRPYIEPSVFGFMLGTQTPHAQSRAETLANLIAEVLESKFTVIPKDA